MQPLTFRSAFSNAELNADHKVLKTAYFADFIYISFSTFYLPIAKNIFCRSKILKVSVKLLRKLNVIENLSERYINADLKISLYVFVHRKTIL